MTLTPNFYLGATFSIAMAIFAIYEIRRMRRLNREQDERIVTRIIQQSGSNVRDARVHPLERYGSHSRWHGSNRPDPRVD
jgi:hypothetical protein